MKFQNVTKYLTYNNIVKGAKAAEGIVWSGVSIALGLGLISWFLPGKKAIKIEPAKKTENPQTDIYKYTYSDAVEAISNSNMIDGDKGDAIKVLRYGMQTDIYRAVVDLVDSNMISGSKVEAIKALSNAESQ